MEVHLQLFIFAALLTTGASLECDECSGEKNCIGKRKTCTKGQDACAIILMQNVAGPITFKRCVSSKICNSGPIDVNFGKGRFLKENASCCMSDACTPDLPELPRSSEKEIEMVCPACYSSETECPEEKVYCSGHQDRCLSFILVQDSDKNDRRIVQKGCTSAASCWTLMSVGAELFHGFTLQNVTCNPVESSQVKKASPPSEFLLTARLLVALFVASWQ